MTEPIYIPNIESTSGVKSLIGGVGFDMIIIIPVKTGFDYICCWTHHEIK